MLLEEHKYNFFRRSRLVLCNFFLNRKQESQLKPDLRSPLPNPAPGSLIPSDWGSGELSSARGVSAWDVQKQQNK